MSKFLFDVFLKLFTIYLFMFPTQAYRKFNVSGVDNILAIENEDVNLECTDDVAVHCTLKHRDIGYSTTHHTNHTSNIKRCFISIIATKNQSGEWRCYSNNQTAGVEFTKVIQVRLVGELAAVENNISTTLGNPVTLHCTTIRGLTPLQYCRFEPPLDKTFSIDSTVTKNRPLLMRYYFPEDKHYDRGDCAVTLSSVKYEDSGKWKCEAVLADGSEHSDFIHLNVEGNYGTPPGLVIGIVLGVMTILLTILGIAAWQRQTDNTDPGPVEAHELQPITDRPETRQETSSSRRLPLVVIQPASDLPESS